MVTVGIIHGHSISTGYHLKEDGGYYIEDVGRSDLYQWMGKGAERLGLVGEIDKTAYNKLFNGELPDGVIVGKRDEDGKFTGRHGYELIFSLNKELSLMICCTENKALKEKLLDVHVNAVKTAMQEAERMAAARQTVKGETSYRATRNLAIALCTHFSSRAGDPQIHTHALVANVTQRRDKQWRALATDLNRQHGFYEKMRDNATFLGHVYQNEVKNAVRKLGFQTQPIKKHGMFEIEAFPNDIKAHFSKRREQIENTVGSITEASNSGDLLRYRSWHTEKKLYDAVAGHSRAPKEKISARDFMARAKNHMAEFLQKHAENLKNFDSLVERCRQVVPEKQPELSDNAVTLINEAVDSLGAFQVAMDANRVIKKAMSLNGGDVSFAALQSALKLQIQSGNLLETDSGKITSKALIDRETRFVTKVKKSLTEITPPKKSAMTGKDSSTANDSNSSRWLDRSGLKACMESNRFCVLNEPASLHHKVDMLEQLLNELKSAGKRVTLLTQTASVALPHVLGNDYRNTLWSQLAHLNKPPAIEALPGFLPRYQDSIANPLLNILMGKGREVFLVDSSQSMSFSMAERLIELSKTREAGIIFLAFAQGRRSPLSGDALRLLIKSGVPVLSADVSAKESLSDTATLAKSQQSALKRLNPRLVEVPLPLNVEKKARQGLRQQAIADDVVQYDTKRFANTQIFSLTRRAAERQSGMIREKLRQHEKIDAVDHIVTTEKRVYLEAAQRKRADFFKAGWIAKTHIRKGHFIEKKIIGIDTEKNQLTVQGQFGRKKTLSPSQLLKSDDTHLIERGKLPVATGDQVRLNTENRVSRLNGLSPAASYSVIFQEKTATLTPITASGAGKKAITLLRSQLNGMNLVYDYAKTLDDLPAFCRSKKHAVVDAPLYAINKSLLDAASRCYTELTIYTDNQKKAQKRLDLPPQPSLATELNIFPWRGESSASQKAVDYGLSVVGSREAAFSYEKIVEVALEYEAKGVSLDGIKKILKGMVSDGDLQIRKIREGDIWLATKSAIKLENRIIDQVQQGKNAINPLMPKNSVQQALEKAPLTTGQKSACELIATTEDRFVMIQGYAGTGKSTMLAALKAMLTESGVTEKVRIMALAPTHKAVKELRDKGIPAETLKQFLVDEARFEKAKAPPESGEAQGMSDKNRQALPQKDEQPEKAATVMLDNSLILLDEASMVSNPDFYALQTLVEKSKNCHCVYLGDIAQLTAVEAGKPCELSFISKKADMAFAMMDEVLRQKTPELKAIAQDLMIGTKGHVERAFDRLVASGSLIEVEGGFRKYPHRIVSSFAEWSSNEKDAGFYWYRHHQTGKIDIKVVHLDREIEHLQFLLPCLDRNIRAAINSFPWPDKEGASPMRLVLVPDIIEKFTSEACQHNRFKMLANDYCDLPVEEQRRTLIGVATNRARNLVNKAVRSVLSQQQVLTGPELKTRILIDSRLTDAELRYSENYRIRDIVQLGQEYHEISGIDAAQNSLLLEDKETGDSKRLKLDWIPSQTILACFRPMTISIQQGDLLKWTKSDKERRLTAHEALVVREVNPDKGAIRVEDGAGKNFTIDLTLAHNQHIDYQYTSTVYGLQGASEKGAMSALSAKEKSANNLRLLYVALTRATHWLRVYVDDLPEIRRQIVNEKGDKASALQAMDLLDIRKHAPSSLLKTVEPLAAPVTKQSKSVVREPDFFSQELKPAVKESKSFVKKSKAQVKPRPSGQGSFQRLDKQAIEDGLRLNVKSICERFLGKPNPLLSSATQWRYGKKGSLSVNISGKYQGLFNNFESGERGNMLTLLMIQNGMNFREALQKGHELLGSELTAMGNTDRQQKGYTISSEKSASVPSLAEQQAIADKLNYIKKMIGWSVPLKGTLAEKYLGSRAIADADCSNLRFLAKVSTGGGNKHIISHSSALLGIVRDRDGSVKAIQTTYLHPETGCRLKLPIAKRDLGQVSGNSVNLTPKVSLPKIAFIVEGIETGLSIRDAVQSLKGEDIQVLVVLGAENFEKANQATTARQLVLVADNDKVSWQKTPSIQKALTALAPVVDSVTCIQPPVLNDNKTDYNDLAKAGKQSDVRHHVIDAVRYLDTQHKQKLPQSSGIKDLKNIARTKTAQEELSLTQANYINQERAH